MKFEDYTADLICRSLGLEHFVDPAWLATENLAIRVVLKPSFHPESVLTLTKNSAGVQISVAAAKKQIWSFQNFEKAESFEDKASLSETAFTNLVHIFGRALEESKLPVRFACADGMGIEACLVLNSEIDRFEAHVSINKAAGEFTKSLITSAWEVCGCPEVKNQLSRAASYLGQKIPEVKPARSSSKQHAKILVLGNPEDTSNLSQMIQKNTKNENR